MLACDTSVIAALRKSLNHKDVESDRSNARTW